MITETPAPTATYRLQFHKDFAFRRAAQLVPYLASIGVDYVYASPIFRATPGSQHGYDICDHNQLNPELGSQADFSHFISELERHGLKLMLDFVPNHMGIAEAVNTWWMDVLENGPSSPFARFFDIDWQPVKRELETKVLLPILGDQYGRVLESGDLKLSFRDGAFFLDYYGRLLPIAPRTTRPLLEQVGQKLHERGLPTPAELQSIIFTLEHLPARTETDPGKINERAREKEVAKTRLSRLCAEEPAVREALDAVVAEIQAGGEHRNFDAYDALISAQPYRLAYWKVAGEEINYRRFFDINNLAAIRMEVPEVFEATHRLLFELLSSGVVAGLRIDHVDGLWDPRGYLAALQARYAELRGVDAKSRPLYLLVEKILGKGERLRGDWPVSGTTGYETGAQIGSVLVDADAKDDFTDLYAKFIGFRLSYAEIIYRSKLLVMRISMASEVNVLGHMLNRISETNRWYRDFTLNSLTTAIREVIACFPVYRTYLTPDGHVAEEDRRVIHRAIALARRRNPAIERTVFEFLRDVLIPPAENSHPVDEAARLQFVMKFQQCTGPITAKGVEDTAFYIYNRLVALNEVGGEPEIFGETVESFHHHNGERLGSFPDSLVATSTHDTKRSEDVRARIAALSEMPHEWAKAIRRWHTANRKHLVEIEGETAPDANEEYLLYQTLVGSWPLEPMSDGERADYIRRIQEYMLKALHESKINSSWTEPNNAWDKASVQFVENILTPRRGNRFLQDFEQFAEAVAPLGMINSLSQTVLKLTIPGVPDIYQGQEMWDFSLVDPDNRRPVDYELRIRRAADLLEKKPSASELLKHWRDGRIKLHVTQQLLRFRRDHPALFRRGNYTALTSSGKCAASCVAFRREHRKQSILVIAPRLSSRVGTPPIGSAWGDTTVMIPKAPGEGTNLFTGERVTIGESVRLRDALADFPVAVFHFGG